MMCLAPVVALVALSAGAPAGYAWPLDLPRIVTSSFGEYRGGGFHAGLDLRTSGIGRDVRAPADGHVARVRCSPWGYGKAVYLQLDDGVQAVFGHLDNFAPELRAYVRAAQHEARSYTVDLYPTPGAFPVKRGDIIARSGETGAGPPHLHYELRDAEGRPVSPRLLGVTWPDDTPPEIRGILVVPDGPDSRVNGDILPVALDAHAEGPGRYACPPVRARGCIAFAVDTVDMANQGANRLGVYRVSTRAGDREVFQTRMDRFSYAERKDETVAYYPYARGGAAGGPFLLQWRWPGNTCGIFNQTAADGWLDLPGQPLDVRLEAVDFLGNRAAVTLRILPEEETAPEPVPGAVLDTGAGDGSVRLDCVGTWLAMTTEFTAPEPEAPVLDAAGAAQGGGVFHRVSSTVFRAAVAPASGAAELVLGVRHPRIPFRERRIAVFTRGDGTHTVAAGGADVSVAPDSAYGILFLGEDDAAAALPAAPVPLRGAPVRLWPGAMPIDAPVRVALPLPAAVETPARAGVYRQAGAGWVPEPTVRDGDRLVVETRRLGTFAVLEDVHPPELRVQLPKEGAAGKRPVLRASVSDKGSGVAEVTVTCNGRWLLVAYDPEAGVAEWERDEDLPAGPRELLFTARDRAGNETRVTHHIAGPASRPAPARGPRG